MDETSVLVFLGFKLLYQLQEPVLLSVAIKVAVLEMLWLQVVIVITLAQPFLGLFLSASDRCKTGQVNAAKPAEFLQSNEDMFSLIVYAFKVLPFLPLRRGNQKDAVLQVRKKLISN